MTRVVANKMSTQRLLEEAGAPPGAIDVLVEPSIRAWRVPEGALRFLLHWAGLKIDQIDQTVHKVQQVFGTLYSSSPADSRQRESLLDGDQTPRSDEEKRFVLYAMAYNQMLFVGEKPYAISTYRPSIRPGELTTVTHPGDLTTEDLWAVLEKLRANRGGDRIRIEHTVEALLAAASALQVFVDSRKFDATQHFPHTVAKNMHIAAVEALNKEARKMGLELELVEETEWDILKRRSDGVPTLYDVVLAVKQRAGSVLWRFDVEVPPLGSSSASLFAPRLVASHLAPSEDAALEREPGLHQYFALRQLLQPSLSLPNSFWIIDGNTANTGGQ